jgi:cysteinyl-tRNA synthetase
MEPFVPIDRGNVRFFICGPTVYDKSHIGHAKTYTQFDFIVKYLRRTYNVDYLINITDVDDKIISRAGEKSISTEELARKYETEFFNDMTWLGNNAFSRVARAHDYVAEVISQVVRMKELGAAYQLEDGWYYDTSYLSYNTGKLSSRVFNDEANQTRLTHSGKRNPSDFVLWKASKPGEPSWESSELGAGRPGWHIEDTAITEKLFGQHYDIHGGASDLIFPHHEAELIQAETISDTGHFVNYWLHTGLLNVRGTRMGKSMGNYTWISQYKEDGINPKVLRFFFLSKHYRSELELSLVLIDEAGNALRRIEDFWATLVPDHEEDKESQEKLEHVREEFFSALDQDFNTPKALAILFSFIHDAYRTGKTWGTTTRSFLTEVNEVFEVFSFDEVDGTGEVAEIIAIRETHRKNKNWAESDRLRDLLDREYGVLVKDTPTGPVWSKKNL